MRGLTATAPDLERATAQEVLAYGVERFHPRLTLACSFQKEESVLVHMLLELEPSARVFTIDTGVLFAETLSTWRAFEVVGREPHGTARPRTRLRRAAPRTGHYDSSR